MKINRGIVIMSMVMIILSWGGNLIYYERTVLKEPLFIKQYSEVEIGQDARIAIHYITSSSDMEIRSVEFPELESRGIFLEMDEKIEQDNNRIGHRLELNIENIKGNRLDISNPIILTKMIVHTNKRETLMVDIGEIYIMAYEQDTSSGWIEFEMSSSSSDYSGMSEVKALKNMKLYKPKSKVLERILSLYEVQINGHDIKRVQFPLTIYEGQDIQVQYYLKENLLPLEKVESINAIIRFPLKDEEGNDESFKEVIAYQIHNVPLTERNFVKTLEEKEKK